MRDQASINTVRTFRFAAAEHRPRRKRVALLTELEKGCDRRSRREEMTLVPDAQVARTSHEVWSIHDPRAAVRHSGPTGAVDLPC